MTTIYDIAIIGGGPAGLFAGYYAKLRNLNTCIIESLPTLGGQPNTLYAQKKIYDVAGLIGVSGEDLSSKLIEQLNMFDCDIFTKTTINSINSNPNYISLDSTNGEIKTKAVIIAVGNGAFNPRKLAVEFDSKLNNHVDYFVNDINKYKDKDVLVAGGGDSAVDWAFEINKVAKSTSIVHRRDTFRALESSVIRMNNSSIKQVTPYLIEDLQSIDNKLKVILSKARDKNTKEELVVDNLLVNYGYTSDSKLLRSWGLDLTGPYIKVNQKMETNLNNIYAIGDVAEYDGKLKLIANAFSEGTIAIAQAQSKIYPDKSYFEHSTNLFDNK
ncbi:ferredoxin--NADP reductase [Companilactobacillus sp. RD055328]|uniref:NAD(P)/FAD-dependent oxidoreductase n=1 Tax=Companilactobacillus sp. RD055328 TaxID=2916634 RepID=UPI001FC86863|nr:NAD(P)/FAD-dependent oxidoreductase [Companilactobacillus sp. RD055328]GKQ42079.1 ferredoxin--NADP reductase [Companilactobacillus sp. RD055328]